MMNKFISSGDQNPKFLFDHSKNKHMSIGASFHSLLDASKEDSSWTPKIVMNIPTPSSIRQLMPSGCIDADKTDIVLFNSKPSLHVSTIMQNALGYPEGCTFYFSGYDGIENADQLKKDIINAAATNGSTLTVDISDHYKHRGNK